MKIIEESMFWKEIAYAMCNYYGIEIHPFQEKIQSLMEIWQIQNPGQVIKKIEQLENNRERFLQSEVSQFLEGIKGQI